SPEAAHAGAGLPARVRLYRWSSRAGRCRARRRRSFWAEVPIGALGPGVGLPPGNPLGQQNAPYLAALDLDTMLLGCRGQRVQGPVSGVLLAGFVLWPQAPIRLEHELSGWEQGDQGDERAAFLFGDASLASSPGPIAQAIDPAGVEGEQS